MKIILSNVKEKVYMRKKITMMKEEFENKQVEKLKALLL
jgi:hypothetical protein